MEEKTIKKNKVVYFYSMILDDRIKDIEMFIS
jgi:hypothetical protein